MAWWRQKKVLLVPLFLTYCTSALHHVIKLYLELGAREGENKKVNLSQSLKASPPVPRTRCIRRPQSHSIPGDPQEMERRSCQRVSRRRRHPWSLLEFPMLIREQEKFVPLFQLPRPPSFLGSPAASGCGCNAWKRQLHSWQYCATVRRHKDQHPKQRGCHGWKCRQRTRIGKRSWSKPLCLKPEGSVHNKNFSTTARGPLQRKE